MQSNRKFFNKSIASVIAGALLTAQTSVLADEVTWKQLYEQGSKSYIKSNYPEAEGILRKALKLCAPQEVNYAKTEIFLADALEGQKRYSEAATLYINALAILRKKTGDQSAETSDALWNIATFYFNRKRYADAEPFYEEILSTTEKRFGLNNAKTADAMADLADLYVKERRLTEAEALAKRVLDIRTKLFGRDDSSIAASLSQISSILAEQGKDAEAEVQLKRSLEIYQKTVGEDDPKTINVIRDLASLCRVQGKTKEVQQYLDRAAAAEKKGGKEANATDLYVQGKFYVDQGRYAEAEPIFRAYQKLDEKPLPNTLVFKMRAAQQAEMLIPLCADLAIDDLRPLVDKITGNVDSKAAVYSQEEEMSSFDRFRLQLALLKFGATNHEKNTVRALLKSIDYADSKSFDSDSLVTTQSFLFTTLRFTSLNRRSFSMCKQCSEQYIRFVQNVLSEENKNKPLSLKNMILQGKSETSQSQRLSQKSWNSESTAVAILVHSLLSMAYLSSDLEEAGSTDGRDKARRLNTLATQVVENYLPRIDAKESCELLLSIADSCKLEGDYAQTKLILSKVFAIEAGQRSADTESIRARALISLVEVNLEECDYNSALQIGHEALRLPVLSTAEFSERKATMLDNMAQAAIQSRSDQAVFFAQQALDALKSGTAHSANIFKAKLIFARALISDGKSDAAIKVLDEMLPKDGTANDASASVEEWSQLAEVCATLGDAQLANRDYQEAKINYAKALDVHRQSRTKYSVVQQVDDTFNIAVCNANLGASDTAANLSGLAAEQLMKYSLDVFPDLSFAEQRNFVQQLKYYSGLLVSMRHSDAEIKSTFGYLIQWRGLLIKALRRQSLMADQTHDAHSAPLVDKWRELKREISKLASSTGDSDQELKNKIADLSEQKEDLERQLLAGTAGGGEDPVKGMTADAFMKRLETEEAYIELSSYQPLNSDTLHYYAIVVTPTVLRFVDIPEAQSINDALKNWRQAGMYRQSGVPETKDSEMLAVKSSEQKQSRDLRIDDEQQSTDVPSNNSFSIMQKKLWNPILAALPSASSRIVLCDDGELSRLPWEMLVNESSGGRHFLTERVDSPREFLGLKTSLPDKAASPKTDSVLLVGAIDYRNQSLALAGTGKEIDDIDRLFIEEGKLTASQAGSMRSPEVIILKGNQPTPDKIKKLLPQVSIAHLATHGFFAATTKEDTAPGAHRAMRMNSTAIGDAIAVRNPLVASGILLAAETGTVNSGAVNSGAGNSSTGNSVANNSSTGNSSANNSNTGNSTNNASIGNQLNLSAEGELTAEELVELNLSKCKLIVLSACETGRGTEERGQGVLGLRSVLMAAGAKSVLLSLWSVDDEATSFLMKEFYKHLLEGKSEAESLQIAENAVRNNPDHPQWRAPCYWAAWALVGQGW
ncbi:MAG TPA: CHAT domain-containing protein [Drouetiella sp.]